MRNQHENFCHRPFNLVIRAKNVAVQNKDASFVYERDRLLFMNWFERHGLMTYIDQLRYQEYKKNKEEWLQNHNVINFDMIHARCRDSLLTKSIREYKTVREEDFKLYPEKEKQESTSSCRRVNRTGLHLDFNLAKKNNLKYDTANMLP